MDKKWKRRLVLAVVLAAAAVGVSRLHIQSVPEYEREGRALSELMQEEETTEVVHRGEAVSGGVAESSQRPESHSPSAAPSRPAASVEPKTDSARRDKGSNGNRDGDAGKHDGTTGNRDGDTGKKADPAKKKTDSVGGKTTRRPGSTPVGRPVATPSPEASGTMTCTIEIRCASLNEVRNELDAPLLEYIPKDGIFLARTKVTVKRGSSAYQVLSQACKAEGIALDAEYTPMYGSYYVRGIGHLYEMDAGDRSGWLYKVNGKKPDVGASGYVMSDGDDLVWEYTCDGKIG